MTHFFFHIPKTGGTSFKRVIETWFRMARDVDLGPARMALIERERPSDLCVTGHFDARLRLKRNALLSRFPWVEGCAEAFVFTLLRDPIEQAVSAYYHERAAGRTLVSLRDFVNQRHEYAYRCVLETDRSDDIEHLLSSFAYVGVSEQLQKSADQLADRLAKPRAIVPIQNVGQRDHQAAELSTADRRHLEGLYSFECELYARARDAVMGDRALTWVPARQFALPEEALRSRAQIDDDRNVSVARLLSFAAQDSNGAERARYDCNEPIELVLAFEVLDDEVVVEPAILVRHNGQTVFSVAYVPERGSEARFVVGQHHVRVTVPANLLNVGRFEIIASVASPTPVRRYDQTVAPVLIEVVEPQNSSETAQGNWRTAFPGGVRPLLRWRGG